MCTNCDCEGAVSAKGSKGNPGDTGPQGPAGTPGIAYYSFAVADVDLHYKLATCISSITTTKVCEFIYPGTGNVSAITHIFVNAFRVPNDDPGYICYLILRDLTHSSTIATSGNFTSTDEKNIVNMGAISNLPATASLFQLAVHFSIDDTNQKAGIGSVMIGQY